jgi:hypothetical protein
VARAGFEITGWFGDSDGSPVTDRFPEVVVLAHRR